MPQHNDDSDLQRSPATHSGMAESAPNGEYRISGRMIAFVAASVALMLAGIVLALQYFVVDRLPELTEARLEEAMKRWEVHAPANYDMDLELAGAQPGFVHVEVRDHKVIAETRDGRDPGYTRWDVWSVPGLFDTLDRDIQIASNPVEEIQAAPGTVWRLRCEFDPKFGYPARYHRMVNSGPEVFWRVTIFLPK